MFLRSAACESQNALAFCLCFILCWACVATAQDTADDLFPDLDELGNESAAEETPGDFSAADGADPALDDEEQEKLTPEQVLEQADQSLEDGKYLEAISRYSSILNHPQFSNNVRALVGRGKAFAKLGNFDLALNSLDRAVGAGGMGKANPFALNERGKIYLEIEKFNEAVLDFEKAVEAFPTQVEFLKNYGKALIKQGAKESQLGDFEAAANVPKGVGALSTVISNLSDLLENPAFVDRQELIEAELSEAYFERGIGQLLMRDTANALADLENARERAPENLEYSDRLAAGYFQRAIEQGQLFPADPAELITNYTNAISTLEDTIEKAEAQEAKEEAGGENADADTDAEQASQPSRDQKPYDTQRIPGLYARIASARIELAKYMPTEERAEHYRVAIESCQKTLDREPQFGDAYLLLGTAYRMLHDYGKAIEAFSETVWLSGSNEARFRRGIAYYYQNELGLALRDFHTVHDLRTGSKDSRAQFWAGIVHMKNQDYYDAIESFSNCISANPRYVLAYTNRGTAYLKLGKYDRAIKDFNEIIRRQPSSSKGHQLREVVYQLKGSRN